MSKKITERYIPKCSSCRESNITLLCHPLYGLICGKCYQEYFVDYLK